MAAVSVARHRWPLRASRADPRAFVVIFERHFDAVNRFLRRRVAADLADDLAAETFVRAFQHRRRYRAVRNNARPFAPELLGHLVCDLLFESAPGFCDLLFLVADRLLTLRDLGWPGFASI